MPFGTKWQLFKDWIREADCDVDHIELFQKSTNGWIRLLGRDNFERALRTVYPTLSAASTNACLVLVGTKLTPKEV